MKGNMFTYCLFCETNKTGYISRAVSEMTGCRSLCPKQIQHTWAKGGGTRDTVNDLMPGYVFLYCAEKADVTKLNTLQGVIRCLSSTAGEYELAGQDEQFALMLLERGFAGQFSLTAVPDCFVPQASVASQLRRFGLDADSIRKKITE